jgi:hypothetical protein
MSEEEEETLETTNEEPQTIEEQLAPENVKPTTLNKNGKPRKQLSPEHLERLAKARAKANAIRKQNSIKKLEDKIENINKQTEPILGTKPKKEIKKEPEPEVLNETIEEDKSEVKERKKKSTKKKTKIIVEQSSEDSDEFEPNDNVVFVKRVSRKKKEPVVEPPPLERQPQMELPPPEMPPKPPRPELTPQQRVLKSQYEGMFSGGFMNQSNLMRRHY